MKYTDLSGEWEAYLDETKSEAFPQSFPEKINLPDTTSNAKLGALNTDKDYGFLTDLYKFEGYAWFRRKISISREQSAEFLTLLLERTRKTAVYIDGKKIGEYCSLCAPHRYDLSGIAEGEHQLVIRTDNTDYPTKGGHLTSPDTQTNWNGITGKIALLSYSSYPEFITVISDITDNMLEVTAEIAGEKTGTATLRVYDDTNLYGKAETAFNGSITCKIPLNNPPMWSEFTPNLLNLEIAIGSDIRTLKFGFRQFKAEGLKLIVNGSETFLRGKHDGLVFPKTGYAPTDTESWLKVFKTAKEYGINHYRFHTCCPPEAAFEAADILGIYLQPELPFWGTIPDEPNDEFNFLKTEGFRILKEYGAHPSFVMMSMGNELWGSHKMLNRLLGEYKKKYPDKLFFQGSNNFQWVPCVLENDDFFSGVRFDKQRLIRGSYATCDAPQGHIQTDIPNSLHSYDGMFASNEEAVSENGGEIMIQYGTEMKKVQSEDSGFFTPTVPVISHEIGQYCIYPDYREIPLYNGSLRHYAYESYRETAKKNGLLPYAYDFFKASGKLAADCYRRELEAVSRSGRMAGFQLLDLQDFPGQGIATVGILNPFMESKGLIEPEEWRSFCNETLLLAELPAFIYKSGEKITCKIAVSNTSPAFREKAVKWKVTVKQEVKFAGTIPIGSFNGRIAPCSPIVFSINCNKPTTAVLHLFSGEFSNHYTLYIYPETDIEITENQIKYGGKVLEIVHDKPKSGALCIPYPKDTDLKGEYCTDFWCYGMFKSISESMGREIPTGTLGLLIDRSSRFLQDFPTETYTTPPWYNIVTHSFPYDLSATDIIPNIWFIDNPQRGKRLGLLYYDGGAVCTSRLWEISDKIEVKHFAASLVNSITKEKKL